MTNPDGVRLLALDTRALAEGIIDAAFMCPPPSYKVKRENRELMIVILADKISAALRAAPVHQCDAEPVAFAPCYAETGPDIAMARKKRHTVERYIKKSSANATIVALYLATPSRLDAGSVEATERAKDALFNVARIGGYRLNNVELNEAVRAVARALSPPALPAGEEVRRAAALARRLCQLFDSGGESQRSVRARHASAIFQLLSGLTSNSDEWQKCDADPVTYLEACERRALSPSSNGKPTEKL